MLATKFLNLFSESKHMSEFPSQVGPFFMRFCVITLLLFSMPFSLIIKAIDFALSFFLADVPGESCGYLRPVNDIDEGTSLV
jgi:hypothetical protein